ncbi:MAG: thioredoxin family protein [Spirochaetaceae bacterium]|jgi:thioredoxin 1|nr:thioredoxin family protein [Spirochaetaceae bacterium]
MIAALNESQFEKEVLNSNIPVVLQFGADWCSKCRIMKRYIEELAVDNENKIRFFYVDVEASPQLSEKHGVQSLPAIALYKNGSLVKQKNGLLGKSGITAFIGE